MEKISRIITLLKDEFPGEDPVPSRSDPLDVLIATMLSQNTTDKTSFIAFRNLKEGFENWQEVLDAPAAKVRNAIKVCGLANQKTRSIRKLLRKIKSTRGNFSLSYIDKMSDAGIYNELLQHDGVGLKTAACVLAFALGRDVFPVDTHVHRVSNRLGIAHSKTPEGTFDELAHSIPAGKKFLFHTLLIRFGRKVCRARNPLCGKCVLFSICSYPEKGKYPVPPSKRTSKPADTDFIILEHI